MFNNAINVGMADLKVARSPDRLATLGLGSCVAICLFEPKLKIGGLAHIMLPDSSIVKENVNPAKFADTAIPRLIKELEQRGAVRQRLTAKIFGGAHMFAFKAGDDFLDIGARNIETVEAVLKWEGLAIAARNVGGDCGRSILLDLNTGLVYLKIFNHGITQL